MPPLHHSLRDKEYDIKTSEAARWICNQPEVMQKIFDIARKHGVIVYDKEYGTWKGICQK